jgi:hypothetical protein
MNRKLWLALAVVAGLAAYLGGQGDDDLLASQKGGQGSHKRGREHNSDAPSDARQAVRGASQTSKKGDAVEAWAAGALIDGVTRWRQRMNAGDAERAHQKVVVAWASTLPPPSPPPPKPLNEPPPAPPPPPMAPRFPHAWVGRFNDEDSVQVADAASAVAPVARAVLSGPQSTWVVRAGDVIEGQWRVDRIQDRTMSLTYLPLKQQQTVVMR